MRLETAASLIAPLVPASRADTVEADWMRAFALSRLAVLAGVFCLLPLALVATPQFLGQSLGLFVALVGSAAAALLVLRYASPRWAVGAAAIAHVAVMLGPWPETGGSLVLVAVLAAGLIDVAVLPVEAKNRSQALVAVAAAGLAVGSFTVWNEYGELAASWLFGLPLLLIAPLLTLILALQLSRQRHERASAGYSAAISREQRLLSAADVAVLLIDRGGHVLDQSAGASGLLGVDPADLSGRGLIDRVQIADRPAFLKATSDAVATRKVSHLDLRLRVGLAGQGARSLPEFGRYELTIRPGTTGQAGVRIEPASASQTVAQPESSADRDALMRVISHEIRSPMNAILGFSELLADPVTTPRRAEQVADYARIIHRSAREAFAVSNALADLMRVEAGDFGTVPERLDLAEIVAAAVHLAQGQSRPDGASAVFSQTSEPMHIQGDANALRTLVGALLDCFMTGFEGRALVACHVTQYGNAPVLTLEARDPSTVTPLRPAGQTAHLGVVEALALRLAAHCGISIAFDFSGATLLATLEFPRTAPAALPQPDFRHSASIVPIRKSA